MRMWALSPQKQPGAPHLARFCEMRETAGAPLKPLPGHNSTRVSYVRPTKTFRPGPSPLSSQGKSHLLVSLLAAISATIGGWENQSHLDLRAIHQK
jgi:hypothetical protein